MKKFLITSFLIVFYLSFLGVSLFAQETLTVTTYYPSPFGSYRQLTWGNFPNTRGMLAADGNAGSAIELGGVNTLGGLGTPYIDFHNDLNNAVDYDARIILTADNTLEMMGQNSNLFRLLLDSPATTTADPLNGVGGYTADSRFKNNNDTP